MSSPSLSIVRTLALLAPVLTGCGVKILPTEMGSSGIPPIVQSRFDKYCAIPACHSSATPQAGLSLSPGDSDRILTAMATQVPIPLVDIGNVDNSYMAIKILPVVPAGAKAQRVMSVMPYPPSPPLPPEDLAILIGWIAGAPLPTGGSGTGGTGMTSMTSVASMTASTTASSTTTTSTTGGGVMGCSLNDFEPGAMSPLDKGTGAGQIPPDIATAIETNCGCHLVSDPTKASYPYLLGRLSMNSIADLQMDLAGMGPAYMVCQTRLDMAAGAPLVMPPSNNCVTADGNNITAADKMLLDSWFSAGIPDGATWMGGGSGTGGSGTATGTGTSM